VLFVMVVVPLLAIPPPKGPAGPLEPATLKEKFELTMANIPELKIAPPPLEEEISAMLFEKVLNLTVNFPALLMAPPFPPGENRRATAVLPERMQWSTVSVPAFLTAPPSSWVKPLAIVRLLRLSVALDATCITCTLLPPSILMPGEAGPVIVRLLSVISGNVFSSAMVPVTLKTIVSWPFPAAQPLVCGPRVCRSNRVAQGASTHLARISK
jgi:hypothetical protein